MRAILEPTREDITQKGTFVASYEEGSTLINNLTFDITLCLWLGLKGSAASTENATSKSNLNKNMLILYTCSNIIYIYTRYVYLCIC